MRAALATILVLAAGAQAEAQSLTASPGQTITIRTHGQWRSNCDPNGVPVLASSNANGGTVATRQAPHRIERAGTGTLAGCQGKSVPGIAVTYTPRAGFTGTDTVSYTLQFTGGPRQFSHTITVR